MFFDFNNNDLVGCLITYSDVVFDTPAMNVPAETTIIQADNSQTRQSISAAVSVPGV